MSYNIDQQKLQQFGSLEFLARQVVEGFITGLHKSPFHGFSVEFAEHRLYNAGESIKHIDWKLYGRSDRILIFLAAYLLLPFTHQSPFSLNHQVEESV